MKGYTSPHSCEVFPSCKNISWFWHSLCSWSRLVNIIIPAKTSTWAIALNGSLPVEVENCIEGSWVPVKEILVAQQVVVGNQIHDLLMGGHLLVACHLIEALKYQAPLPPTRMIVYLCQFSQSRLGELLQHPPHHLVSEQHLYWTHGGSNHYCEFSFTMIFIIGLTVVPINIMVIGHVMTHLTPPTLSATLLWQWRAFWIRCLWIWIRFWIRSISSCPGHDDNNDFHCNCTSKDATFMVKTQK